MKSELITTFYNAIPHFFSEIPNSVRVATQPVLEVMDEGATADAIHFEGGSLGNVSIRTPRGDKVEVFFGHSPAGEVALRIDLKATNLRALSALVDIVSAGMVGLDGVSMVEGWAKR